ncbi:MAG: O-antigen polymerase [Flavipsychrobacter sp.]|jgi:O-antigen ligase|nr:O-antigen polymerase [Flavipsychrobacter sp.]
MIAALKNNWFNIAAFSFLLLSVMLFAYTGNYYILLAPVTFLYVVLLGVNWQLAYWIFLFTIPASIQINFSNDTMAITLPDEPIMWMLLLLSSLVFFRNPDTLPKWWWQDGIVFIVVLQYIVTIVAVIFSKMLFFSMKFLLAKTWLLVCYFILPIWIFREKKDFIKGFMVLLIPMLITIIVILIHHSMLNFSFDKVQKSMTGLYYNHVDYSTVISMFFPLLLIAWPLTKGRGLITRFTLLVIILIFIAGIIFSYARAAVVGIAFAVVVGLAIRMKLVNWIMPAFYAMIILLMCYLVPNNKYIEFRPDYNKTFMHKNFTDHLIATFRGKDMSSMERLYRWIAAVRMSNDRPITGYGPRAFYYYYKPYAVTSFQTYVSRNPEHSTTHNYFLYMLVEQGWPAMLLYALLIVVIFAKAQRIYHRFKDRFYRLVTIGLAMTIAVGFVNNFFSELIETHKVAALFFIPLAMLIILDKKSRDEQERLNGAMAQ